MLEVVKDASRRTRALLDNAQITSVDGELVRLEAPKALAKMIAEDSNAVVLLRTALTKVVGGEWKVEVGAGGGPAARLTSGTSGPSAFGPDRDHSGGEQQRSAHEPTRPRTDEPEPDPRDDPDFEASRPGRRRVRVESRSRTIPESEGDANCWPPSWVRGRSKADAQRSAARRRIPWRGQRPTTDLEK